MPPIRDPRSPIPDPRSAIRDPRSPIHSSAPTRICDLGGWTDTWFAERGVVCHLAVWPGVDVELSEGPGPPGVEIQAGAASESWRWQSGPPNTYPEPLLAATLDEAMPPADRHLLLRVWPGVPAGASMGTSAATCVAVLSAFDVLHGSQRTAADQVGRAHAVETVRLGWQSGVQDQWSMAPGAAHLIEVDAYPHATCRTVTLPHGLQAQLDDTLLVVWLGRGHLSTAVHDQVVAALRDAGAQDPRLETLRALAHEGAAALALGDLPAYGECLTRNTEAQRRLHPGLVSTDAQHVIDMATATTALGWKINGAGGTGGTVTILCADRMQRDRLAAAVTAMPPLRVLPVTLQGAYA